MKRNRGNHVDNAGDVNDEGDDVGVQNRKRKRRTKGKGEKAKKQNLGCEDTSSVYDQFDGTMNEDGDSFDEEDEGMCEMIFSSRESNWRHGLL